MPPAVVALLFGAGVSVWVYTKVMRTTGGNTKNALVVSAIIFVFSFIGFWLILNAIDRSLG
jgi:hypothetical protein